MKKMIAAMMCGALICSSGVLTSCGKDKKKDTNSSNPEQNIIRELELTDTISSSSGADSDNPFQNPGLGLKSDLDNGKDRGKVKEVSLNPEVKGELGDAETDVTQRVQNIKGGVDTSTLWMEEDEKLRLELEEQEKLRQQGLLEEAPGDTESEGSEGISVQDYSGLNLEDVVFGERYRSDPPEMSMVMYEGLTLPVLDGVTVHSDGDGLTMTSMNDLVTVNPAPDIAINRDTLAYMAGTAQSFVEVKQCIINEGTVVGLVTSVMDGLPVTQGIIYTLQGNCPLRITYTNTDSDASKIEQVIWAIVWRCPELKWEAIPPRYTISDGTAVVSGAESTSWKSNKEYELPQMNYLSKEGVKWAVPSAWKVLDVGNSYSANSENSHIIFAVDVLKTDRTALTDFSLQVTQAIQNGQQAERIMNYSELEDTYWEVVGVGNKVIWYKIYSTGDRLYRATLTYDRTQALDEEKWLAEQVIRMFELM